jgi:Uncharacterized protein conserved in bacteria (DUF2252)
VRVDLARAHRRSDDRVAPAAYPGGSARFGQAIAGFAETCADQNERDCAALQNAGKEGKAEATTEIQDSTPVRSVSSCVGAAVLLR